MPLAPQSVTRPERLWIANDVVMRMISECERAAPVETGGILLGYWGNSTAEPVIAHIVGPGPDAIHAPDRFLPDHDYQLDEIARLYKSSERTLRYLGDWHSHPGGGDELSVVDRKTLRRIARCRTARVEHPVMLVMTGASDWEPTAWMQERVCWWKCFPRRCVRRIAVSVFDDFSGGNVVIALDQPVGE